jgi:uncharacterized phiE125 gp8 family phage protein
MSWLLTSAPAVEPLDLVDVKNFLKVTFSTDDDLITDYIKGSRQYVERLTGRALITQTITEYWDAFPASTDTYPDILFTSVAPVQSVTSLSYVAAGGTPASYTTWDNTSNAKYYLDAASGWNGLGQARILKNPDVSWPSLSSYRNSVKLVYVAGFGYAASDIPGPILTAMQRLIGVWYYAHKGSADKDWQYISDLLNPYKTTK